MSEEDPISHIFLNHELIVGGQSGSKGSSSRMAVEEDSRERWQVSATELERHVWAKGAATS